jgi:superfamily II DNA or RNA helicase
MSQLPVPGIRVSVRDADWRVARVDAFERCAILTLEGPGRQRLRVIDPFDRITPIARDRVVRRKRRAVLRAALSAVRADRPPLSLWTAAAAAIDLHPYQLEPALAVLRGATRVLLADAVGLGKTIQAGLILSELRERGWVERALVVCPPGVRQAWADELRHRFGITAAVFDQPSIAGAAAALPPGLNPWTTHATMIASIDFIKRPEVMAAIADVPIDIVIADEAHHLTPGTDRGDSICRIAARAPWCVLVSATPHSGDEAAFRYLTAIGRHADALTIFRRSRRDAGLASARRERTIAMRPPAAEIELLSAVDEYARAIWTGRRNDPAAQLVAITIARRAASSPLALERTLRRRLALLSSSAEPTQTSLPWDEDDEADGSGAPVLLARPGLDDAEAERLAIERLLTLVANCGRPSKLQWLAALLRRIDEPAIVFTEYRDTLDAVVSALPQTLRVVSICGATPPHQRRDAIDAFNHGDADVLVATDTAGEGLNLHHRCRLVIDLELPWNPIRLEQRLGRVDRLGQRRRAHALRLYHAGTIEERVRDRLHARRGRAGTIDHPQAVDERATAAAVFDDDVVIETAPAIDTAVVAGAGDEHARVVMQRAAPPLPSAHAIGVPPRRRTTATMLTLYHVSYANDLGAVVAERPCALAIQLDARQLRSPAAALRALPQSDCARQALGTQASLECAAIEQALAPLRDAIGRRITHIREHQRRQRALEVQQSLFDRRAETDAARQQLAAADLDAALVRRRLSIASPVRPARAFGAVAAIWPAARR